MKWYMKCSQKQFLNISQHHQIFDASQKPMISNDLQLYRWKHTTHRPFPARFGEKNRLSTMEILSQEKAVALVGPMLLSSGWLGGLRFGAWFGSLSDSGGSGGLKAYRFSWIFTWINHLKPHR
jgi:hypothetical protein